MYRRAIKQSAQNRPYKTKDVCGRLVRIAINFCSLFLVLNVSVLHDLCVFRFVDNAWINLAIFFDITKPYSILVPENLLNNPLYEIEN